MALLHIRSLRGISPFPSQSLDFHAHRHAMCCESVKAVHDDFGFGYLVRQGARFEGWAEQGFDAAHGGFGEASSMVIVESHNLLGWILVKKMWSLSIPFKNTIIG